MNQHPDPTHDKKQRQWLASLLLRHGDRVLPRFARLYDQLAQRPRAWRRQLKRRLAITVTGAAMLLALGGLGGLAARAAPAGEITVANGEVNVNKNNKCSLIEAIENANDTNNGRPHADCAAGNPSGADVIILPSNGKFTVNKNVDPYYNYGYTALPLIDSPITIQGNGSTINRTGKNDARFFTVVGYITGSADLTLNDLNLTNGKNTYYSGGAVYATEATLTVNGSTITGGQAGYGGGAIYASFSDVTITNSTFNKNKGYTGGAISIVGGSMTITDTAITGNSTADYGSGGGVYLSEVITIMSNVEITGNKSSYNGGGIAMDSSPATITGANISGNTTGENGNGGAIYSLDNTLSLIDSRVHDNKATYGGGLFVYGGTLTAKSTTVSSNKAEQGGGIYTWQESELAMSNSTLSGNSATQFGGGLAGVGNRTLTNVTLSGNTAATTGGGIHVTNGSTTLRHTLLAGNTAPTGRELHRQAGTTTANAHNLFGFGGNAGLSGLTPGATDVVAGAALAAIVGPLADNTGATMTHALPANSPAIDAAPSAACAADPIGGFDQRGQPRNANGSGATSANECDVGAYEFQPAGTVDTPTPTATHVPTETPTVTATSTRPGGPTATPTTPGGPTATATAPPGSTPTATSPAPTGEGIYLPVVLDETN